MNEVDVSVVVVTYESMRHIDDCLTAVFAQDGVTFDVTLVDNASRDGSADYVSERFPAVTVLRNEANVGFAAANNRALRLSSGRYALLLNPDTIVRAGALAELVRFLDSHHDAGAAGSVLRNTDGSLQYSVGRFPTVANQIGQCLLIHKVLPFAACLNGIDTNPAHYSTTRVVEWVFGAALMIRRPLIQRIGLLDEAFFMFSEEVDWCMRIRNAGLRVYLVPQSVVVHHGRTRGSSPSVYWMLVRSHLTFVRKHHGLAAAEGARGLLFAGFVLRWVGWSLRAAAGSSADATSCAEVYGFSLRQMIRNRELS